MNSAKHPIATYLQSILLLSFGAYAVFRTSYSLYGFLSGKAMFQHDIYVQYTAWVDFMRRDTANDVLSHPTYLPHAWLLLTPIFSLGWNATKWVWFLCCFGLHIYIWHRISRLCELRRPERCWFLILYFCLLSVGLTIALGNLVIVSFAAILAAFPFEYASLGAITWSERIRKHLFLFLSTVKHITVFPVFLLLLLRRPRLAIPTGVAVTGILLVSMWWAHVAPATMLHNFKQGNQLLTTWMHETTGISLMPVLEPLGNIGTIFLWTLWAILFMLVFLRIKDPFIQLSCLLMIAILPIHHRDYDMIVAAPVLALLIKQGRLLTSLVVTLCLSGLWDTAAKQHFFGVMLLQHVNVIYHQLVILGLVAILFSMDYRCNAKDRGLTRREPV